MVRNWDRECIPGPMGVLIKELSIMIKNMPTDNLTEEMESCN
jgi:hypothetical protein